MRARAPGSISAIFAPPADGATGRSRGASLAVRDGVVVDVEPAGDTRVTVDGEAASFEPVERVLGTLGVTATVAVELEAPIGHGFGASGAATLSTALAANAEFDLGHDREDLLSAAHRAEVAAGTGLGDVFVQEQGGVIWSTGDDLKRVERTDPVEYTAFDEISTAAVLGDPELMDLIRRVGLAALDELPAEPELDRFVAHAWEFAQETTLATERVADAVEDVSAAGGVGSMAMLGETVFAVGVDGLLENRTRVATSGARLL